MFVTQKEYDREREARIRAEARAEELAGLLKTSQAQVSDLLDRFAPKPKEYFTAGQDTPHHLSSAFLRNIPAVGRAGIERRNKMVEDAMVREEKEAEEKRRNGDGRTLTPEEQQAVQEVLK